MIFLRLMCLLCLFTADVRASSHWIVTETGLIQRKEESPFLMARPFDLLSFLNQETRWQNIYKIHDDLIMRQKRINTLWAELEVEAEISKHIGESEYCQATGNIEEIDWYRSFMEDGRFNGIPEEDFMLNLLENGDTEVPNCKKISSLTFSMSVFEHLEGMINREHLNATPEMSLPEHFSTMSLDQFGHWVANVLRMNTTSWLHYNLAALYWRVKGNVPKALECSRRAVHHAPRYHKSIPLLCMGSIFHRSRKTEDAIIVLGASVDHAPRFAMSHFALAQSYAILGDYNNSLRHFNMSIKLNGYEFGFKYRDGVLCHNDMLTKMQYAQRTLKKLSFELAQYNELESMWVRIQTAFLKTMNHDREPDFRSIEWITQKMTELTGLKVRDIRKDSDWNSVIRYFIDTPIYKEWKDLKGISALETAFSLESALKAMVEKTGGPVMNLLADNIQAPLNDTQILKEIGPLPMFPDLMSDLKKFVPVKQAEIKIEHKKEIKSKNVDTGTLKPNYIGKVLYPPSMKVSRNIEGFDTDPEWPSNAFCKESASTFPDNVEAIYPVYLPFEHKGISIKTLLTEKLGVPASIEIELPWHPPACATDKDLHLYTTRKGLKVQVISESIAINILRPQLLRYLSTTSIEAVKKMQDAEIGHRIYVAMRKKLAPKWIINTLAALYWRVRGNTANALNCLLSASRTVEARNKDIVLVSMASVLLEMGLLDECSTFVEEAYKLNSFEPPTNYLLAQLSMIKKNDKAQLFHLKQVLRVDPRYMNGFIRNLLNAWSCILKQVNTLRELGDIDGDKDLCAEMEPGVSMVCERDGTNCHISHTRCTTGTSKESSTLVRMLELKEDDNIQTDIADDIDAKYFDKYIKTVPKDRNDKSGHQKSYNLMLKTVSNLVKGCGIDGCNQVDLRELNIREEECSYQHLQLDYWLHVVGFKEQLSEADPKLVSDIKSMTPSNKKVPECRIPLESVDDFFIPRILRVDTENWEPVLSLMHQFAEMFEYYDYATLGAKIAKYVETHPTSMWGAIAAGWWCGGAGHGACAATCAAAAHAHARSHRATAVRHLMALLHMQSKHKDAKDIAYLAFYSSPKSKIEAFLVGVSHTYNYEYDEAIWMYRYSVTFDEKFLPAKACLHITMCLMLFGDHAKKKNNPPKQ